MMNRRWHQRSGLCSLEHTLNALKLIFNGSDRSVQDTYTPQKRKHVLCDGFRFALFHVLLYSFS